MDRKGILGLVLIVALFGAWNFYYFRRTQEAEQARKEAAIAAAEAEAQKPKPAPVAPKDAASPETAPKPETPLEPAVEKTTERLATSSVEYEFTNLGGGVERATLLHHLAEKENRVVVNRFGAIPIGVVTTSAGEYVNLPFSSRADAGNGTITFERTDERQVQLTKTFTLPRYDGLSGKEQLREEYLLKLDLSFTNRGGQPLEMPPYFVHTGSAAPIHRNDQPIYNGFNYFRDGSNEFIGVTWFEGGGFWIFKSASRPVYPEKPETMSDVRWAGVTNQYFTTLLTPLVDPKAMIEEQVRQRGVTVWARRFGISDEAWRAAGHGLNGSTGRVGVDGALGMAGFRLQPGETVARSFQIYCGPGEYRRLRELGNYEAEILNFGIFGIVSKTLLNSMNTLKGWFGNYAWAIIVLTIIIKLLMWPLQNKATASMKKMQALQPKMVELREKYKDDPQAMNVEVMKMYKQYGVNPFGGCLPMLIQIPIFFGFYNMLGKAVELRNSKFLWVEDLSQPDTIFEIPGIGFPVNILPLLMAVTMLWSMMLQPKSGDQMQQRIFMFMPLIFIVFCYNFASALALYWTVQNLFSVVQLYVTRNQTAPTLQKVTAPKSKR